MSEQRRIVGWREWVSLPELGLPWIKAKVDTGARTSALHAFDVEPYQADGRMMVRFAMHPLQQREDIVRYCTAEVIDERMVSDSGGHREKRFVIQTPIELGGVRWPIEITLTNRDSMRFRMLLGRTALSGHFLVEADASYCFGKPSKEELYRD